MEIIVGVLGVTNNELYTSRIFKFFLLSFFLNKPNLKIWRPCKSAFTIGLSDNCPIIFIRC